MKGEWEVCNARVKLQYIGNEKFNHHESQRHIIPLHVSLPRHPSPFVQPLYMNVPRISRLRS